jgi:hypothetical protein
MCICVQTAPRQHLNEPWDAERQLITLPAELNGEYLLRALRAVLAELGIGQDQFGARCWCGEPITLLSAIPSQRSSNEVSSLGA